jgi:2-polyprenyl-3-methyl-5-hydroxy-6-metoxy-1,4-benzoquinol methylase
MAERDQYFLGQSTAEQQRLQRQAEELADEARCLFDAIGIAPGSRAVEIGCGPQGCLGLLSERVGQTGSVIGIDMNDDAVALARAFIAEKRLTNVEVRQGNGKATGLPREAFDLVTARLVLVNIPEPEQVVTEMAALAKPGGTVALHEADWGAHLCDPPLPAWDRLMKVLDAYAVANGIDLYVGRRLARMLRAEGLVDVQVRPLIHLYPQHSSRRGIFADFVRNLRERIVQHGLISEAELTAALASLDRHLENPGTLVVSHLFLQAWGRKPEARST